jgi:hypothetical protein
LLVKAASVAEATAFDTLPDDALTGIAGEAVAPGKSRNDIV